MTSDEKTALDHARYLAECGVPVFIAKPARTPAGEWDARGGTGGYYLPPGWQHFEANPSVVDDWEEGWAVCAVMGHGVDGLDIDAHHGGERHWEDWTAKKGAPRSYGRQRTPSGGTHDLIASLGVGSPVDVLPGVDLRGGKPDGSGRGFLFLAPTRKLSKATGEVGVYEWETSPNVDAPVVACAPDDSGAALAELVSQPAPSTAAGEPYEGPAFDQLTPGQQQMAREHVSRQVELWRAYLTEALEWPEGERDQKGRGWELLTKDAAWALARLAAAPWTELDEDRAGGLYDLILPPEIAADPKCKGKWYDGIVAKAAGSPPDAPPWEGLEAPDDKETSGDRKTPLAVRLRQSVELHYDVFPAGDDGRIFVQAKSGGRAELLSSGFVIRAARGIGSQSSALSAAATEAAKVLTAHAEGRAPRELAMRVSHQPGRVVLDLAQPGNTHCVVVTPSGWTVQDAPPADVVFQDSGRPLPTPRPDGSVEELRKLLRWPADDPRWPLVRGWLAATLLATVPRPILGFFGPQGSAKTTTGRFVVGVVDPKPAGVLGGGFGKNGSDDETKSMRSYLPAWDNVSSLSSEGADRLSRLVTGDMVEKRKLYSDADMVTIQFRRTGVVTGVTVPRGLKPDTLDRFVLVPVHPLGDERLAESTLEAEWQQAHPEVLGGVLDDAVAMLAGAGRNPSGLRMADYAEALWAIDPDLYWAYDRNVGDARAEMAEDDPFIGTLRRWLEAYDGEWTGTAGAARSAASGYISDEGQWWPPNPKSFADELTRTSELLRAVGIRVVERRSHGHRLKTFTLEENPA